MNSKLFRTLNILILASLVACSSVAPSPAPTATQTATLTPIPTATQTHTPTATPTPVPPESLQAVQERLGDQYQLVFNEAGYFEVKNANGQAVEGVRVYEDGRSELVVPGIETALVQPNEVITSHPVYGLVWGARFIKDGIVSEPQSVSSEAANAGFVDFPFKLGADEDSMFAEVMRQTAIAEHIRAMAPTELYNPASEFEGLTIILNAGTKNEEIIEDFDNTPKEWLIINSKNTSIPGRIQITPSSQRDDVVYDDDSRLAYTRPMQVALGKGWIPFWRRLNGIEEMDVLVPIVAKDTDKSIKLYRSILRETDISRIAHLLNRDERGKIWCGWLVTSLIENNFIIGGKDLQGFSIRVNNDSIQKLKTTAQTDEERAFWDPKNKEAIISLSALPEELDQVVLVLFVKPQDQKN